jgi:hypothetical protein
MSWSVIHCKCCGNAFPGNLEKCAACGCTSPHGRRNILLKWVAILVFLAALAYVAYAFTKVQIAL